ncbi:MAG: radical SAM protein, partial [Peptococcaceae bacterium]|nr:radical SAM protein [Peptococcaceae bacterium]
MNIYGITYTQLEEYLLKIGEKPSKAPFIYQALYKKQLDSMLAVPELRRTLLEQLDQSFSMELPVLLEQTTGDDTIKFLFSLSDGSLIEAVLMRQKYGNSLCISSQVGCNMACAFCQSGRFKKKRNLSAAELTGQIIYIQKHLQLTISNIVLMGIGEPFDNYDNVMQFLEIVTHPHGLALGTRHITVSTCGLVPQIEQYASHPAHGLLAISLHAPDDETRSRIMPVNRKYPVTQLMDAARSCIQKTGKKVMLEYVMLNEINDHPHQAQLLAD